MFFLASKTLDLALDPWWWVALPVAFGALASLRGGRRLGALLITAGLLVFLVESPFCR